MNPATASPTARTGSARLIPHRGAPHFGQAVEFEEISDEIVPGAPHLLRGSPISDGFVPLLLRREDRWPAEDSPSMSAQDGPLRI